MKAKIIVRGTSVQDVGYRLFLLEKAGALSGFEATNTAEGLTVAVEGRERIVNDFIRLVKAERPPSARVSAVKTERYAGTVMRIEAFTGQFGVQQLAKIATTGVEVRDDIKEMKGDIKEIKVDTKEMKGDIKEIKVDTKEIKGNTEETKNGIKGVLLKQDETIAEIRNLRTDLKEWMEQRFSRLETDVRTIKEKVGLT